jgi:hypothetical protein
MADSQPQNPHPEDKPKTVFIFAGATTPEFEKKFSDEAKKQGAAAVEFVNVPDVPFADPKVELELEAADNVCKLYEQRLADFLELFKKVVNSLSWRDHQTPLEIKTIHHLCDRIIHVPAHVLILHKEDPIYSYIDCASLNRSLFESAVNCLYLFQDKTNRAFASLISNSIDEDIKYNNELLKWLSHKDPGIAAGAAQHRPVKKHDSNRRELLRGIGFSGNPPFFPNIRVRCDKLGERWRYLYADRYRELCSWSHIHMGQVFSSPSHAIASPKDLAHAVSTGTVMLYLAFHLVYLFLDSITENDKTTQEEINKYYLKLIGDINPILAKTGTFTAPSFTVEK